MHTHNKTILYFCGHLRENKCVKIFFKVFFLKNMFLKLFTTCRRASIQISVDGKFDVGDAWW
jgi:hypothetical protein